MLGNRSVVHGCSNIADLNTGVSLQNSPVLKESALLAGVQYRCLVTNGNSSQGRFRKYGKMLEKKKEFQEIRWEIQVNQLEIK